MKYFGTWRKLLFWFQRDSSVFWARLVTIQLSSFVVKVVQTRHKQWTGNDVLDWTALLLYLSFTWSMSQIRLMPVITLRYLHTVHPNDRAKSKQGQTTLYIADAHAFVIVTLRLGLRAPLLRMWSFILVTQEIMKSKKTFALLFEVSELISNISRGSNKRFWTTSISKKISESFRGFPWKIWRSFDLNFASFCLVVLFSPSRDIFTKYRFKGKPVLLM